MFKALAITLCYLAIVVNCQLVTKYPIPVELFDQIDQIDFRQIQFDTSRISTALNITRAGYGVNKRVYDGVYHMVGSRQEFSSGKHYFHYQVRAADYYVIFGVYDDSSNVAYQGQYFPYQGDGVSFGAVNYFWTDSAQYALGSSIMANNVVGLFLNFDQSTVTFFLNNALLGSMKIPANRTYFATVSIATSIEVVSLGFN